MAVSCGRRAAKKGGAAGAARKVSVCVRVCVCVARQKTRQGGVWQDITKESERAQIDVQE